MENTLAQRLIQLREKNNFSQSFVARQIGVTPALISAYEKLERKPSLEKLIALADIYHVSTDYLLGRTYQDDSSKIINVEHLSDKQIRILRDLIETMKQN
ncbi:MAG: helix-turn-helix transcriptional regulator [Lachnospiraceae bacterium]|nr:helix-turn-helix transcriptional regulator [Lachnospiraceae bacterium]